MAKRVKISQKFKDLAPICDKTRSFSNKSVKKSLNNKVTSILSIFYKLSEQIGQGFKNEDKIKQLNFENDKMEQNWWDGLETETKKIDVFRDGLLWK